jgi:hypothetical protein
MRVYHIKNWRDIKMTKALILSALIGGMSPYLPFWRFDSASQPVAVAIVMFILSFVVIYPDEIKKIGGN